MSSNLTQPSSPPPPRPSRQPPRRSAVAADRARPRGRLTSWRTLDLVAAAMIGVAFGVAYWGWSLLYTVLEPAFRAFPPIGGLLGGPWLLAGVVGGLVVRRPGAALFAELLAANVEYLIGNQWGASTLVSGALQGLGVELALAIVLWRRFGWPVAALGGALAAVLETVYEWYAYWAAWDWAYKLAYGAMFTLSGVVVAGIGGWALTRGLARTGALDPFPAGASARAGASAETGGSAGTGASAETGGSAGRRHSTGASEDQ